MPGIDCSIGAINVAEALSLEERQLLLKILAKQLRRQQNQQLLEDLQETRQDVVKGSLQYGFMMRLCEGSSSGFECLRSIA